MDEQHFRLRGHPSEPGPGPRADDYLESRGNGRALAYVQHAVLQGDSVVVLTGAPGSGKSVLIRKLLQDLAPDNVVPAVLAAKRFDVAALLAAIARAFRAPLQGHSVDELRAGLQAFLATLTASGRRALLVVDDAQHLLPAAINELTGLASLRSSRDAPLQVVLAGRPELRATLQRALVGASGEPVFLFCDVGPLSAEETRAHVEHRLRSARPDEPLHCTADAHQRIHEAARGVPGAIDPLCDRLLAIAEERHLRRVSADVVEEARSAPRAGLAEAHGGGDGRGAEAARVEDARGVEGPRPVSTGTAAGNPRARVALLGLVLAAVLVAVGAHEYQGLLAEKRLSSLAVATRVAAPVMPALPATPAAPAVPAMPAVPAVPAVPTVPVEARTTPEPLPVAAPTRPATAAVAPAPPSAPVAEPNDWEAVPVPSPPPATRLRRASEAPAQEVRPRAPAPVAGACSAAVVALGLCDAVQNP